MNKILSIVIPVYNNWINTNYCLTYLSSLDKSYEIIIVDNGSTDGTDKNIKKYIESMHNLIYIRNDKNIGFGAAVNMGFKKSTGQIVMFLNNDIKIKDKSLIWLEELCNFILKNNSMLVGPTGGFVDINNNFNFKYETSDINQRINYMSAWCLSAKRDVWNLLIIKGQDGPFDSKNFFAYFEDTDLGFRSKQQNIIFHIYPLPISHIGQQTSKFLNTNQLYLNSKYNFIKKWKIK